MSQRVFISYSRKDASFAAQLAADLRTHGADVWIDVRDIQAGVKWSSAIQEGLDESGLMILILSPESMRSKNVEDEWQYFRDENKPIIPVLIEPAKIHFQLKRVQYIDFHSQDYQAAFAKLREELVNGGITLSAPAADSNAVVSGQSPFTLPLLEWVNIPAGKVMLEDNAGRHAVEPFAISKYPVTNAQFDAFIVDGGYSEDRYWKNLAKRETTAGTPKWNTPTHPRETVNWFEAMAFCRWLGEKIGLLVTLPTEMQWQWAAVANKGWKYPYGDIFESAKTNTRENGIKKTTPVDLYPAGGSPFGVFDLCGNVWEWCLNEYLIPPTIDITSRERRVVRGGSWDSSQRSARAGHRYLNDPGDRYDIDVGFRVVTIPTADTR